MSADKKLELYERGREARTTHAGYRLLNASVDNWPVALKEQYLERYQELIALPQVDETLHRGIISQLCRLELVVSVVSEWLFLNGLLTSSGKAQPILASLALWENSLSRCYERCGLTVMASSKMRPVKQKSISDYFREVSDAEEETENE